MDNCFFCEIQNIKERIIWENNFFFALYDTFPVSPGHTLIIPKRHIPYLRLLEDKEWNKLKLAIQNVMVTIQKTNFIPIYKNFINDHISNEAVWFCEKALAHPKINTKCDGYNYGINEGTAAGQTIHHLHWHIIPRFIGDMDDPRGGVRFVIPNMGNYKIPRKLLKTSISCE